jgi:hypothetical protein
MEVIQAFQSSDYERVLDGGYSRLSNLLTMSVLDGGYSRLSNLLPMSVYLMEVISGFPIF